MIRNPLGILLILALIEGAVLFLAAFPKTKKFFQFPPFMFWIYFLPMVFSGLDVIPQQSGIYPKIGLMILPASLVLLLVSVDLKAIFRIGRPALLMMFAGSAGIILTGPIVILLFWPWLPSDAWSGFAALSASWTGGSANMLAVKEAIGTPDKIFLPMVVVDTVVAYSWMGLLIALAGFQKNYDRWNHSDPMMINALHPKISQNLSPSPSRFRPEFFIFILFVGFGGAFISTRLSFWLSSLTPIPKNTWVILLASTLGILLSWTPLKKLENYGASRIGYILLYFVLTSLGARASLQGIFAMPVLIVAGITWVFLHGFVLYLVSRWTRTPLCLVATASQANIGGPVSAPVVAAVYEPALVPVGLLLGILGNVMGTYSGLFCAQLCHFIVS